MGLINDLHKNQYLNEIIYLVHVPHISGTYVLLPREKFSYEKNEK